MNILLVTLLLVLATAAVGAISGVGAGFAYVLFLAAVVAGLVLNFAGEDWVEAPRTNLGSQR
jgi:hypothetical protein